MKYKYLFLLLLIMAVITITPQTFLNAQSESQAVPYIYYYSWQEAAFVIEKADGTDSRLLGQDVVPDNYQAVMGDGWSPSGDWFAWHGREIYADYGMVSPSSGWIISADGQQVINLSEQFDSIEDLEWIPVADGNWLLITANRTEENKEPVLYDVDNQTVTARLSIKAGQYSNPVQVSDDGAIRVLSTQRNPFSAHLDTLTLDGYHKSRTFEDVPSLEDQTFCIYYHPVQWLPDGRLAMLTDAGLVLENVATGARDIFEMPFSDAYLMHWSPDGQRAFIYSNPVCSESNDVPATVQVWLFSLETQTFEKISDNALVPEFDDVWSPDGQKAVSINTDFYFEIYDAINGESSILDIEIPYGELVMTLDVAWQPDSQRVYLAANSITVYDFETQQTETIPGARNSASLSPDGDMLLYYGNCYTDESRIADRAMWSSIPCMQNRQTGDIAYISPNSTAMQQPYFEMWSRWHPSGEWLFLEELFHAGGFGNTQIRIMNQDGSLSREITQFPGQAWGSYDWLPEQVNVDELPAALNYTLQSLPEITLRGHRAMVSKLAWSGDGRRMVSSGVIDGIQGMVGSNERILVWDVESGNVIREILPPNREAYTGAVGLNADGSLVAAWQATKEDMLPVIVWDISSGEAVEMTQLLTSEETLLQEPFPLNEADIILRGFDDYPLSSGWVLQVNPAQAQITGRKFKYLTTPAADNRTMITLSRQSDEENAPWIAEVQAIESGEVLSSITLADSENISSYWLRAIVISPDGHWLAVQESGISLWNLETGEKLIHLYPNGQAITFSPDSSRLAVASSFDILIWNLDDLISGGNR